MADNDLQCPPRSCSRVESDTRLHAQQVKGGKFGTVLTEAGHG
jgi:hypothetical protein